MQLAVTIALTVIYVGLALTLGGAYPKSGMPWRFFVPGTVAFCAAFVATRVSAALPIPWVNGRRYGLPPRRVHLFWRAAIRLPVWAPALLVPWHVLLILRMHFDFDWVLYLAITLFLLAAAQWRSTTGEKSGSSVPVFYDPDNPRDHVVACSCWFEAD